MTVRLPLLHKIWSRTRVHLWGFVSTIFLATCVGALVLAIVGPAAPNGSQESAREPVTIHIGSLTMHIAGSNGLSPAAPAWFKNGSRFDLSLLIPEMGLNSGNQSPGDKPAGPGAAGLEWQTQVTVALYSDQAQAVSNETVSADSLDDLPGDADSKKAFAARHGAADSTSPLDECLSASLGVPSCQTTMNLGAGFVLRYARSRVLSKPPDLGDRVAQVEALFGFSSIDNALRRNVTKLFLRGTSPVEVAALPR